MRTYSVRVVQSAEPGFLGSQEALSISYAFSVAVVEIAKKRKSWISNSLNAYACITLVTPV